MFSKEQRLHTTEEILTVFRRGEVFRSGPLSCFFLKSNQRKVTVIIDKKVSKLATTRNKIKRRIREILKKSDLQTGSIIIRGYAGVEKMSFEELVVSCSKVLVRIKR